MQLQLITQQDALQAIADEWRELDPPTPFQSPDWLLPWWQVYGDANRELAVVVVRDRGGSLIGLCPWYVETTAAGRKLRWLGDGDVCSDHSCLIIAKSAPQGIIRAIVEWFDDRDQLTLAQLELQSVDCDDERSELLVDEVRSQGWLLSVRDEVGSCYVSLPADWNEYLASVSKNHRKRCRRWQREFFEAGRAYVRVATEPLECLAAYQLLVRLHNQRRQSAGCSGAFEDNRFRRFHELAIERMAQRGQVQLRLLYVDGELAAAEYLLTDENAFYAYQSGLSDAGATNSAGSLSVLSLLQAAADSGRQQVDLLRGVELYKFSWGGRHRPARTIVARRRTLSGVLRTSFDKVRHQLRAMCGPRTSYFLSEHTLRRRLFPLRDAKRQDARGFKVEA